MSEFRALQLLALYNGPGGAGSSTTEGDVTGGDQAKKAKHMDEDLEEFLLQQVLPWHAASSAPSRSLTVKQCFRFTC
jgi:hypothetical protein